MDESATLQAELKNLVWIFALPAMMAELLSKWLCFPLSKQLRGFQFSLLAYSPGAQAFTGWMRI